MNSREKSSTVLIGVAIVLVTTTVPYLTMLNVFLFSGIFLAGLFALTVSIMRYQVRLSYNEAFVLGFLPAFWVVSFRRGRHGC